MYQSLMKFICILLCLVIMVGILPVMAEDYYEHEYDEEINLSTAEEFITTSAHDDCSCATIETGAFEDGDGIPGAAWQLYECGMLVVGEGFVNHIGTGSLESPWHPYRETITSIIFLPDITAGTSLTELFAELTYLTTIEGLQNIDTSNVTDMGGMFSGARYLTKLDLSGWDTSNVTNMRGMFSTANHLTDIVGISELDTSSVTNMASMFDRAGNLTSLDISRWDTSNVTSMEEMFYRAENLTNLNISDWNTGSVTNMRRMFVATKNLTSLDISKWDVGNVTDMSEMFANTGLGSINISEWNTSNLTDIRNMFWGAINLTSLDLSKWNTYKLTDINTAFGNTNLTILDLSGWNTNSAVEQQRFIVVGMFLRASSLKQITLGEHFRFPEFHENTHPHLASVPTNESFTGYWQNVGNGTTDLPQGEYIFTSDELVEFYRTPGFADTWVWQRVITPPCEDCGEYPCVCPVYAEWLDITANGASGTITTTQLTLTFDEDIRENIFKTEHFTVSGAALIAVTGTGNTLTLEISRNEGIRDGDIITVTMEAPPSYIISQPLTRDVAIHIAAPPPLNVFGRVAGGEHVTTYDAMIIAQYLAGNISEINLAAADINGDGRITVADIVLLMRWLAGHNVSHMLAINL